MSALGNLMLRLGRSAGGNPEILLPGETHPRDSEIGVRPTPENMTKYLYRQMWVDPDVRAAILDIRRMDRDDGRVKRIHARTSRATVKGLLKLKLGKSNQRIERLWRDFSRRLMLTRREKLESDARGLMMEGNLALQWVLGPDKRVVAGVRMPAETLRPNVTPGGVFADVQKAYEQYDLSTGAKIAEFALWQLSMVRLTPDNFDDLGSLGRPYLDSSRSVWRKLDMTEQDLVIRRRMRAPLRMSHSLEGATAEELHDYRSQVERDQAEGNSVDYYMNKKGAVEALQGDAKLNEIADVVHLLETFFSGAPAPKALFGYAGDLNRDILEDLKQDFFDELDALQDAQSYAYQTGFELELLLQGINPFQHDLQIVFAERRTESLNQSADRALKYQAMGASRETVLESAGLNVGTERDRLMRERTANDPYPEPNNIGGSPTRVSITPGNAPKKESATTVSN